MIALIYHHVMWWYTRWRLRHQLRHFRRWAKNVAHDPMAMLYTDEAIVEGFRQLKER
jgi:hypothetical protein